jgi:anti-sigma B factor antagonist
VNRALLTPFSAPLESARSLKPTAKTIEEQNNSVINLYLNERRVGEVIVLDFKGRVRITGGTTALHRSIRCLVEEGKTKILLNLSQVTHIDSGGLGELVASRVTVNNKGGELKLSHLTERMSEVMTMTNLLPLFEIYDDEHDAVASFNGEVLRIKGPLAFLGNENLEARR